MSTWTGLLIVLIFGFNYPSFFPSFGWIHIFVIRIKVIDVIVVVVIVVVIVYIDCVDNINNFTLHTDDLFLFCHKKVLTLFSNHVVF